MLLTEELSNTHQVVRRNPENHKEHAILLYGSKGQCEGFLSDLPAEEGVEHIIEEIDPTDPRLPGAVVEPPASPDV